MIENRNIQIKLINNIELKKVKLQLKLLLKKIDNDFIPPLSSRNNTTQMQLDSNVQNKNIDFYLNNIMNQNVIIVQIDEKLVGFMSFIDTYNDNVLPSNSPCNYITTIGIFPEFRGYKIATKLYKYMMNEIIDSYSYSNIVTRTWSTNISHINLLYKLNFKEIKHIINHRGNNIDTIYYAYKKD